MFKNVYQYLLYLVHNLDTILFKSGRENIWEMMKIVYHVGIWRSEKNKKKNMRDDEEGRNSRRENEKI